MEISPNLQLRYIWRQR